jgi:hypothetical protein
VSKSFLGGPTIVLPTEVPITFADSGGGFAGDGMGPIYVSLDSPFVTQPGGSLQTDRVGTGNLAPLIANGQINPALSANHIAVIQNTHGKTSQLTAADIEAIAANLRSLE